MRLSVLLSLLPLALAAPAQRSAPAPLLVPEGKEIIADQYIVKFKEGSSLSALDSDVTIQSAIENATHVYAQVFNGFATTLDAKGLEALRNHPEVSPLSSNSVPEQLTNSESTD